MTDLIRLSATKALREHEVVKIASPDNLIFCLKPITAQSAHEHSSQQIQVELIATVTDCNGPSSGYRKADLILTTQGAQI
jgi:precorrin-3B methylase